MPYCPECRDEFQDWVDMCPDCRVPLVHELLLENRTKLRQGILVRIAVIQGELEAQICKGILHDNGIESLTKISEGLNIYLPQLILKHEIFVLEEDVEKARELLMNSSTEQPWYQSSAVNG